MNFMQIMNNINNINNIIIPLTLIGISGLSIKLRN